MRTIKPGTIRLNTYYNPHYVHVERFPPALRRAITSATELAAARGCEVVSPEHLLLVIAKDSESAASFIFEDAGVSRTALMAQLERSAPTGTANLQRAARLSPATMHVLDVATGASNQRLHHHVGTEHLALALALVNENPASMILADMGFTREKAEAGLQRWIDEGMPRRRGAIAQSRPQSQLLRTFQSPLRKIAGYLDLGWKVYGRKSLGHPRFVTDPYPLYRWLRTHEPVRKNPIAPVRVLTRHADVQTILKDARFKKDPFAAERLPAAIRDQLGMGEERRQDVETVSMLFLDPPQHTRVRGLLSKAFTPRMIESLRPRIQQITDRRLEKVIKSGNMDVIETLAYPLPVVVIAELLGFPPEDFSRFKKWSDALADALALNPTAEAQAAATSAMEELRSYFDQLVRQIEQHPGENLLSTLLAMERDGDSHDRPAAVLSREELFINRTLLLVAGHETTTNLIGNGMLALLRNRSQLQLLKDRPLSVHATFIAWTRDWLNRVLPDDLVARTDERPAVESNVPFERAQVHRRYVRVFQPGYDDASAGHTTLTAPYKLVVDMEPITERFIRIISSDGEQLVTVIEFLSPPNKMGRGAIEKYVNKRGDLIGTGVHVVEIDLVKKGDWETLLEPHICPPEAVSAYRATVRLARQEETLFLYPLPLRSPLYPIPIPLRQNDPEVKLDLSALVAETYETGRYGRTIDYSRPCDPPLDKDDERWADELLREAGRR